MSVALLRHLSYLHASCPLIGPEISNVTGLAAGETDLRHVNNLYHFLNESLQMRTSIVFLLFLVVSRVNLDKNNLIRVEYANVWYLHSVDSDHSKRNYLLLGSSMPEQG